ncbi:MAG: hypothetical protein DRP10_04245, partial [Candidatus Aenigmatarchaeota archaeon]
MSKEKSLVGFNLKLFLIVTTVLVLFSGVGILNATLSGITVTYPNGGENLSGTAVDINWTTTSCDGENVSIYWGKGGDLGTWNPSSSDIIVTGINCSLGTYDWNTTGLTDGTDYRIKVRASDDPDVYDISDNFFTIDNTPPAVPSNVITAPNASSNWKGGSHNIVWTNTSIADTTSGLKTNPIKLEYWNGSAWVLITSGTANNGSYTWNAPSDITVP